MKRSTYTKIITTILLVCSLAFLEACGGGFSAVESGDSTLLSSSDSNFLKGKALYEQNCASCHGDFANSAKKDRTADQIKSAIGTQPLMQNLSSLTQDEVLMIAYALSNPKSSGGPIYQCSDPSTRGMSYDRIRRLSKPELSNTLKDLLGTTIFNDNAVQLKLGGLPSDDIKTSPTDFFEKPNSYLAGVLLDISLRAGEMLASDSNLRSSILDSCTAQVLTEDCIRKVLNNFGGRVLRRKLTTAELTDYVQFYNDMGGGSDGLQLLVIRLLQSPSLVFHVENGNGSSTGGRIRLTDYEIASRISYLTASTTPDAQLLAAADKGELQNLDNVRTHVKRLLALDSTKAKVKDFFRYYTRLQSTPVLNPSVLSYSQIDGNGLGSAMETETFDFINYIVWNREGTFGELMTSTAAFPKSAAMSSILDSPVVSVNAPVSQSTQHPGLFHRPALLSNAGNRTSPIIRGAHIRKMYLCDELGQAPADAISARENELGDISNMTNRDRTALLTQAPACIGCHGQINNLGFTFEKFSPLGKYRSIEPVFDMNGNYLKDFPINTVVNDPKIEAGAPEHFNDSAELVTALADSKKAQACFAKKVFEFYKLKTVDKSNDSCLLSESSSAAAALSLQTVIVDSIANEDIFWRKEP